MEKMKMFSLPRSGSNYLKAFLEKNLEVKVIQNKILWKHAMPESSLIVQNFKNVITIWKDPYSWLVSIYKISKNENWKSVNQTKQNFEDFIKSPFYFNSEDGVAKQSYSNPLEMYNEYCDYYLKIQEEITNFYIFDFNELVEKEKKHIEIFSKKTNLKKKRFQKINKVALPSGETVNFCKKKFDKDFYVEKKYMDYFSKQDLNFVKRNLTKNYSKLKYVL